MLSRRLYTEKCPLPVSKFINFKKKNGQNQTILFRDAYSNSKTIKQSNDMLAIIFNKEVVFKLGRNIEVSSEAGRTIVT